MPSEFVEESGFDGFGPRSPTETRAPHAPTCTRPKPLTNVVRNHWSRLSTRISCALAFIIARAVRTITVSLRRHSPSRGAFEHASPRGSRHGERETRDRARGRVLSSPSVRSASIPKRTRLDLHAACGKPLRVSIECGERPRPVARLKRSARSSSTRTSNGSVPIGAPPTARRGEGLGAASPPFCAGFSMRGFARDNPSIPATRPSLRARGETRATLDGPSSAGSVEVAGVGGGAVTGSGEVAVSSSCSRALRLGVSRVADLGGNATAEVDGKTDVSRSHSSTTPTVRAPEATPTATHFVASAHGAALAAAAEPLDMEVAAVRPPRWLRGSRVRSPDRAPASSRDRDAPARAGSARGLRLPIQESGFAHHASFSRLARARRTRWLNSSRARRSRDATVPTGMPTSALTSEALRSSAR